MTVTSFVQRFLLPRWLVSLYYFFKYRCKVSTRAEVELSPLLRIGRGSEVSSFTKIKASYGPLRIGRSCSIGAGCFLSSTRAG